jgi:cytochrome c oxidase subunit 3
MNSETKVDAKINHDLSKFKHKSLNKRRVCGKISSSIYVVEGANFVEMNTVVNYLLISFLYNRISRVSRFFRCNYKYYYIFNVLGTYEKRGVMKWSKKLVYTGTLSI